MPQSILAGIADMKVGSSFLNALAADHQRHPQVLGSIDCQSFYCRFDLMVVPSWLGVLPVGPARVLPASSHQALIKAPRALEILTQTLLNE